MIAIILDGLAYKRLASGGQKTPAKGIVISVAAGLLMGWFYSFVAQAMGKIDPATKALEAGKLSPYTAIVLFSAGLLLSNFIWNSIMMVKPLVGRAGAVRRLLQQGQRPPAPDRHPRRHDLEHRHELQHHRRHRGRPGAVLRAGPGSDHDRRALGRVHLEGVQGRSCRNQQTAWPRCSSSTSSGSAS